MLQLLSHLEKITNLLNVKKIEKNAYYIKSVNC